MAAAPLEPIGASVASRVGSPCPRRCACRRRLRLCALLSPAAWPASAPIEVLCGAASVVAHSVAVAVAA